MNKVIASLVTFALLAGPAALSSAGATLASEEPDCQPADDGTDAYICHVPEECREHEDCEPPPECEWIDDTTVRCEPPEDGSIDDENQTYTTTSDDEGSYDLIRVTEGDIVTTGPAADCRVDREAGDLVCQPTEECRRSPDCKPPETCEALQDGLYRCEVGPGEGPPSHAEDGQAEQRQDRRSDGSDANGTHEADCRPGPRDGTFVCPTPPDCQDPDTDQCPLPPECEPSGNGTAVCTPPDDADAKPAGPTCEQGPERGTLVCEPPAECEGQIGETARCTPPPECQPREDGTFLCELPDRASPNRSSPDTGGPDGETPDAGDGFGEDDLFGNQDPEARAQARAQVAASLSSAAEGFHEDIQEMRSDYEQEVDQLRAEYRDGKAQLREDYQDCRAAIPDDADPGERNDRLRDCLDEARQGMAELKANLTARHDEIKQSYKEKAEQARTAACQEAERAALDAIARHGLFDANPGDLLPERALDLCPSFADFERGGEAR